MNPTSTDFVKNIIIGMMKAFNDAQLQYVRMFWSILISELSSHWLSITLFILFLLVVSILFALMGRWGMFGSLLYNILYFGTFLVLGLILGPDIFANNYFDIFAAILYVACFILVGITLKKTGFKRY